MAATLGIVASIIAVLQLSQTVVNYITDVKDASKDRRSLLEEIAGATGALSILEKRLNGVSSQDAYATTIELIDGENGPLQQFKMTLNYLEKKLRPLDGLKKAVKALTWPFHKAEIQGIFSKIERLKAIFILALQDDLVRLSQEIKDYIKHIQDEVTETGEALKGLNDTQRHSENGKILQWLSMTDPSTNHSAACTKREAGTGLWLLEDSEVFLSWRNLPNQSLWIHGIPGCGKTVLCSSIIEHVKMFFAKEPRIGVAYFYFDFNETQKQSAEGFFRSILVQLALQTATFPDEIQNLYSQHGKGTQQPNLIALKALFHLLFKRFWRTYIIMDALDECAEREDMLQSIVDIVSDKSAWVNVLLTSRKELDITERLKPILTSQINIQAIFVDADIKLYVRSSLSTDPKLNGRPDSVKLEMEKVLVDGAHGMFRWVQCQLDTLRSCLNRAALSKALRSLPKTLDKTYERILVNIEDDHRQQALACLQWLAFSARPLRLVELAEAAALQAGGPLELQDHRLFNPNEIFRICSSLITSSGQDGQEVRFAHYSVLEYLNSDQITKGLASSFSFDANLANTVISEACLGYLLFTDPPDTSRGISLHEDSDAESPGSISNMVFPEPDWASAPATAEMTLIERGIYPDFPLLEYAAEFWFYHAKIVAVVSRSKVHTLCLQLFNRNMSSRFFNWLRIFDPDKQYRYRHRRFQKFGPPLYYASLLGLLEVARELVTDFDFNVTGGTWGTPLNAASFCGHESMVLLLLAKGAKINAADEDGNTALHLAARMGHLTLVQLLVDKGADINARDTTSNKETPLEQALVLGSADVVRLLVALGAEVDGALAEAARSGKLETFQLLLELSGKAKGDTGRELVWQASRGGHVDVVRVLLNAGTDISSFDMSGSTPLHEAVRGGHECVVALLLEGGAAIETKTKEGGRTPCQLAAAGGHKKLVQLLLDKKANLEATDENGKTALLFAAWHNHVDIVKLLVDKGANLLHKDEQGWTALHYALSWGAKEELVRLLLDNGMDPNAKSNGIPPPLSLAARGGNEAIIALLLNRGADVKGYDCYEATAMHVAVRWNHEVVVRLLDRWGADLDAKDIHGSVPLHVAAKHGRETVVRQLIELDADVWARDKLGRTILHIVMAREGHRDSTHWNVVQLLVATCRGLIDAKDLNGMTPLQFAVENGQGDGMRLLLELGADNEGKSDTEWWTMLHASEVRLEADELERRMRRTKFHSES